MGVCSPGPLDAAGDTASLPVVDKLPCVGSLANLKSLLEQSSAYPRYFMRDSGLKTGSAAPEAVQNGIQRVSMASDSAAVGYSGTNLQTAGVDEADIVKTDGQYIYQVGQNGLNIIQAYPAQTMKIVIHVDFEQQFSPLEIYTDAARLIVIGTSYTNRFTAAPGISPDLCPPGPSFSTTMVLVYDIADKTQITKIREVELEGNYVSSRKIGHSLYLVANQYINYYYLENPATAVPCCRDSAVSTVFKPIDLASIHYFPGHVIPSYMLVAGINLTDSSRPADIQTYLGASENIYASEHNLYIAASTYSTRPIPLQRVSDYRDNSSTRIYRFALNQGSVSYTGKGDVPGTIINQFSMDESELNMRIATTSGDVWQNGQYTSRSNVYILDQNLQIKGRL
jgi:uncharacterized secreted protein with C-terminal beta-propeller domain